MRQVFSAARLETVEGVAALLNAHGIQTWISNDRSYKGTRRRSFSYRDNAKDAPPPAAVWVVHAQDQTRARALLREAGLIDSTREPYLPGAGSAPASARPPGSTAARARLILLGLVIILAFATRARHCQNLPSAPPPETPPQTLPASGTAPEPHIIELAPPER